MNLFRKHFGIIAVVLLGVVPLYPLFFPGLPITHDGQDHVARIANFFQSLSEGNMIPRWAGGLNWGYGHPILMFLYPFPSYAASAVHFVGFNFVDSVKIVFGITFILSGVCMYLWIRNVFGEKSGIIAGVLYMLAPYRFVDLFVRGAIGEHVAFLFVPLIFYCMERIYSSKNTMLARIGFSFSVAGLLLSHNAISLMFIPVVFVYACILIFYSKKRMVLLKNYLLFSILGLGLSAFFVFPAFFEGKYTLRDIVTGSGEYKDRFVSIMDFVSFNWSFGGSASLSKQIGIVQILGVGSSLFVLKKTSKKNRLMLIAMYIVLFLSLFVMLPVSDFVWVHISLLQKFQFPWRFLSVVVFTAAVLSSATVLLFKNTKHAGYFTVIVCLAALVVYSPYYRVQGFLHKPEIFYSGIYDSTTDTGESAPIWSVRFMEKRPLHNASFITGNGTIKLLSKDSTTRVYDVQVETPNARIRENTLYFPNWSVYVNGKKTVIEFQDPTNRGLITYNLEKGHNQVEIKFEDTRLRIVSNLVTIASLIALTVLYVVSMLKRK